MVTFTEDSKKNKAKLFDRSFRSDRPSNIPRKRTSWGYWKSIIWSLFVPRAERKELLAHEVNVHDGSTWIFHKSVSNINSLFFRKLIFYQHLHDFNTWNSISPLWSFRKPIKYSDQSVTKQLIPFSCSFLLLILISFIWKSACQG